MEESSEEPRHVDSQEAGKNQRNKFPLRVSRKNVALPIT
jgi:hypothetical protein